MVYQIIPEYITWVDWVVINLPVFQPTGKATNRFRTRSFQVLRSRLLPCFATALTSASMGLEYLPTLLGWTHGSDHNYIVSKLGLISTYLRDVNNLLIWGWNNPVTKYHGHPSIPSWWLNQPIWKLMRTSKWVKSFPGFGGENSKNMCVATDLDKFVGKCGRIYHGIVEKMAKFTNQTVGFLPRQIAFYWRAVACLRFTRVSLL